MKYRRPWRNACASREPAPGRVFLKQIQKQIQRAEKYGSKLISNGVFKQTRGSIRKDTPPPRVGKAIQSIHECATRHSRAKTTVTNLTDTRTINPGTASLLFLPLTLFYRFEHVVVAKLSQSKRIRSAQSSLNPAVNKPSLAARDSNS